MVDTPRKSPMRRRWIRRVSIAVILLVVATGIGLYVSSLKSAIPSVDRATVYIGSVKRGPMPFQARGLGKLIPEETRWISATTEGRVEKILLEAGAKVTANTVLLELSNPQLQQETLSAEWDWKAEQSSYADLKLKLERDQLTQLADMAKLESDCEQAVLRYEVNAELAKGGLISGLELKRDKANVQQLSGRLQIEKQRSEINRKSISIQLAERRTRMEQREAAYALKKSQLNQLKVRAGVEGVLQLIEVDVGQRVSMGANLARIANPNRLKAELNIAETQAKDIQIGQKVSIDTRNGIVPGRVSRIDPAVKEGSVRVDVSLETKLPKGARPDLSVEGTILLEQLSDVMYVGYPVQGQPNGRISLFKLEPDGREAKRVPVHLGRSSVNIIEIKEGLKPGDQVILSDMAAQDGFDSICLK